MKKRNLLLGIIIFLLLSGGIYYLLGKPETLAAPAASGEKIVFGISPFQDTYMPMLGQIKGWYAAEGVNVEFKVLGWTEIQEALSSRATNKIDIGINNISSVVATWNKNKQLVYYYGFNVFDNGFALMIRPNGKLRPLSYFTGQGLPVQEAIHNCCAQLKGLTVITTSNTDMEQGVAAAARKGGLDFLKDIKIINLNPDEGLASFLTGTGDAYIGGIPQRTKAGKERMIEMITGSDLGPPPINGIVTTKAFAKDHAVELSKILTVWFRIVNYTNNHLDEVGGIIAGELNKNTASGFTTEDFKRFWNNFEHYPPSPDSIQKEILSPEGRNYWKLRWEDCNSYFYTIKKAIPASVRPEDAFYMEQAQKDLLDYLTHPTK